MASHEHAPQARGDGEPVLDLPWQGDAPNARPDGIRDLWPMPWNRRRAMSHYVGDDCLPDGHRGELTVTTETIDRPTAEELSGMLARYVELDQAIKPMVEERDELKTAIKAYIEEYGEPVTNDSGWVASVRKKNKPMEIDLISAAQKPGNDEHIVRAASMGLLKANLTPLRAQSGKVECADILLGYAMPMGETSELRIERA